MVQTEDENIDYIGVYITLQYQSRSQSPLFPCPAEELQVPTQCLSAGQEERGLWKQDCVSWQDVNPVL